MKKFNITFKEVPTKSYQKVFERQTTVETKGNQYDAVKLFKRNFGGKKVEITKIVGHIAGKVVEFNTKDLKLIESTIANENMYDGATGAFKMVEAKQ